MEKKGDIFLTVFSADYKQTGAVLMRRASLRRKRRKRDVTFDDSFGEASNWISSQELFVVFMQGTAPQAEEVWGEG